MSAPIVVGIDGSVHAWRALDWAADQAIRRRLPLRLVHGAQFLMHGGRIPEDVLVHLIAEREDLLAEARQYALKIHPELRIDTSLAPGDPGHALVAESEQAALVAVGSRGVGGFEGLLFGSVGLYVSAHARCPVLVVSRSAPFPAEAPGEIVLGLEGRVGEDRLLQWAFAEAESRGARILALHAVGGDFPSPRTRVVEDMELSAALAGVRGEHPDVPVDQMISDRTAARALVEASEHAALVVVGARHRHAPSGIALGRVNHAVLHHAACPVVVVPPRD
ncbi:universal stress protein [Actinomadura nitritigenes]|uniref:Universal stress protein n=1 Tax=Actinomadura nitritigenes TaxID=134602 RepID=A0ABS3RHI5_9ACTN|nr:universal stress protein [Actinomadura nitritigenes]MBO2445074.1 universal stress protein [Actinomadura nitritigenes]